jgi:starch phosphorylase
MKAVLNGGVIIGTLDGANIEIREEVGAENLFAFGHTAEEIVGLREKGYNSSAIVHSTPELQRVVETIGKLAGGAFKPIVDVLLTNDRYFHCADFASYMTAQQQAADTWIRREEWARMSILNTARSGKFSADRTVSEYAEEIWEAEKVVV